MTFQLVFNPRSLLSDQEYDAKIASQAMKVLLEFIRSLPDETRIRIDTHFNERSVMRGYSIYDWCEEHTNSYAEYDFVLDFLVNKDKLTIPAWIGLSNSEERIGKDYCFNDKTWALAYFFDFVLFSLHTEERWDKILFECEYFDLTGDDEDTHTAIVRHASRGSHLLQHRRLYNCHPKHCHHLPFTGKRGTKMDLCDSEAEKVLNQAVQIPTKKQLIGYSKRTRNLYTFQPESPSSGVPLLGRQNQYHGYPVEPAELHEKVTGSIYNEIIDSLAERGIVDTPEAKRFKSVV